MKKYTTKIRAIDPTDGKLKTWSGPYIDANTKDEAVQYCKEHLGYCKVDGQLLCTVDEETGLRIDYDNLN